MWAALVRQLAVFLFTKRGKRIMIFVSLALLCFLTALLTDSQMYLTASVTGAFTATLMVALAVGYFGQHVRQRNRARREAEQAIRRAAASQSRQERFGKAKSAVAGAAKTVSNGAASTVGKARSGLAGARGRLAFWRWTKKPARSTHRTHLPR